MMENTHSLVIIAHKQRENSLFCFASISKRVSTQSEKKNVEVFHVRICVGESGKDRKQTSAIKTNNERASERKPFVHVTDMHAINSTRKKVKEIMAQQAKIFQIKRKHWQRWERLGTENGRQKTNANGQSSSCEKKVERTKWECSADDDYADDGDTLQHSQSFCTGWKMNNRADDKKKKTEKTKSGNEKWGKIVMASISAFMNLWFVRLCIIIYPIKFGVACTICFVHSKIYFSSVRSLYVRACVSVRRHSEKKMAKLRYVTTTMTKCICDDLLSVHSVRLSSITHSFDWSN